MSHPAPTPGDLLRFDNDGFLVVKDVIDEEEQAALADLGDEMIRRPRDGANDWDWRQGEPLDKRGWRIVQSAVDPLFPWLRESRFRTWAAAFGAALMRQDMEFWYEQFLGKPPGTGNSSNIAIHPKLPVTCWSVRYPRAPTSSPVRSTRVVSRFITAERLT